MITYFTIGVKINRLIKSLKIIKMHKNNIKKSNTSQNIPIVLFSVKKGYYGKHKFGFWFVSN